MLATSCRYVHQIKDIVEDITTMPTTAENVKERAMSLGSDVALVATVADTQYVLFRQGRQVFKKEQPYRCYTIRYVKTGDNEWTARVIQSRLEEPEQPMLLTRTADNALTLTVDSVVIAVTNIVKTDSTVTFDYGFDEPDRTATLYLYGKARQLEDPFAETSIQQMLSLSLMMESLIEDSDYGIDTIEELDVSEMPEMPELPELADAGSNIVLATTAERYAAYSHMDSLASELGFKHKSATASDDYIKFEAKGLKKGNKRCYSCMEQMGKAASKSGCRRWEVAHKTYHRNCTFTIEWK